MEQRELETIKRFAAAMGVPEEVALRIAQEQRPAEQPAPPKPEPLYTADELRRFEAEVAREFEKGKIRAPIHLSGGNEEKLLEIFEKVDIEKDWVCTAWRSHYHCLLKGVPATKLWDDICAGKSITLCYPEHQIISSAIVGGICSIAIGIAAGIRRTGGSGMVWCFMGDMTATGGAAYEAIKYAGANRLPVTWVVEANMKSVETPTIEAWGPHPTEMSHVIQYAYEPEWPHQGIGKRVEF